MDGWISLSVIEVIETETGRNFLQRTKANMKMYGRSAFRMTFSSYQASSCGEATGSES